MQVLEIDNRAEEPQILLWGEGESNSQTVVVEGTQGKLTIKKEKVHKKECISLESRRYIGNKNKLMTWIFDIVAQNT
jgi:hypothetical protein